GARSIEGGGMRIRMARGGTIKLQKNQVPSAEPGLAIQSVRCQVQALRGETASYAVRRLTSRCNGQSKLSRPLPSQRARQFALPLSSVVIRRRQRVAAAKAAGCFRSMQR